MLIRKLLILLKMKSIWSLLTLIQHVTLASDAHEKNHPIEELT